MNCGLAIQVPALAQFSIHGSPFIGNFLTYRVRVLSLPRVFPVPRVLVERPALLERLSEDSVAVLLVVPRLASVFVVPAFLLLDALALFLLVSLPVTLLLRLELVLDDTPGLLLVPVLERRELDDSELTPELRVVEELLRELLGVSEETPVLRPEVELVRLVAELLRLLLGVSVDMVVPRFVEEEPLPVEGVSVVTLELRLADELPRPVVLPERLLSELVVMGDVCVVLRPEARSVVVMVPAVRLFVIVLPLRPEGLFCTVICERLVVMLPRRG